MMQSTSYSTPSTTTPFSVIAFDAFALGVDQLDVRPVEGRQVLVVEGRALAQLAVPRLERLGCAGSFTVASTRPRISFIFWKSAISAISAISCVGDGRLSALDSRSSEILEEAGPLVADQIFLDGDPGQDGAEVVVPMGLPSGLERLHPFRIGRLVAAHVHRRRRALEHVELLRVLAEMRHALNRGRAGADDAHALVARACAGRRWYRRRCSRSPSDWCGRCAP